MSNKDALRALQVRLASRLQQAREQPRSAGWLAVECGSVGFLLPLAQAGEIHPSRDVTAVPHATAWLAGVVNVRGQLSAVLDLAVFLGLRGEVPATFSARQVSQLVLLNPALRVNCALLIDRLAGLRDRDQLKPVPLDAASRPPFAPRQWLDATGRSWDELDLSALVRDPGFLDVAV
jgi:twitching motility protein PilI